MHVGRVDIVKKPVNMKNITGTIPGVLNIKKVKGTEKRRPSCTITIPCFILSERYPARMPPKPPTRDYLF